jgi:hypothetical protein
MPKAFPPFEHWLEGYHSFDEVGKVDNPSVYYLEILISQNSRSKTQRLFQSISGKSFERIRYVSRELSRLQHGLQIVEGLQIVLFGGTICGA